jgi:hypothetical protein
MEQEGVLVFRFRTQAADPPTWTLSSTGSEIGSFALVKKQKKKRSYSGLFQLLVELLQLPDFRFHSSINHIIVLISQN